jgi:hypothetical protein
MGDRFVGSDDHVLATTEAITSTITEGDWVNLLKAKIYELVITTTGVPSDTLTLKIETDLGVVDGTQKVFVAYTEDFDANSTGATQKIPLGGMPGGRRIRYTAVMDSGAAVLTLALKETRSGL